MVGTCSGLAVGALLLVGSSCSSVFGLESPRRLDAGADPDDLASEDASDAMVDAPDAPSVPCYGAGIVSLCPQTTQLDNVQLSSSINTTNDPLCSAEVSTYCTIMGSNVTVNGEVRVRGSRPLVLFATGNLVISGTLDVGSRWLYDLQNNITGEEIGAGEASAALCNAGGIGGNGNNMGSPVAAGGGGGGSFSGKGGDGAIGTNGSGGAGGAAGAIQPTPTVLRGGCAGAQGGTYPPANAGGQGGHGGGAVYLIAEGVLDIDGVVIVGGQGGHGGTAAGAGGGGGGSGGFIGLDGAQLNCSGRLSANGGAGGEGGGINDTGVTGLSSTDATMQAAGGYMNTNGGDGGAGSFGNTRGGGAGMQNTAGGGGGGGGAGMIKQYRGAPPGGGCNISPPLS